MVIKLAKAPKAAPTRPDPAWKDDARRHHQRSIAASAAGKLTPKRVSDLGLGLGSGPGPEYRNVPMTLDISELEDLGARSVKHPGRGPVTRRWFRTADGAALEVLSEVPPQGLDDRQPVDQVLVRISSTTAETIEVDGRGHRRPMPPAIITRWFKCRVHQPGTWEES
jgi:hypothetical protein